MDEALAEQSSNSNVQSPLTLSQSLTTSLQKSVGATTETTLASPPILTNASSPAAENSFFMYQLSDLQQVYLDPLNARMLLSEYGRWSACPIQLSDVPVLELTQHVQSDQLRRRYKFLAHLPINSEFRFAEVDLSSLVSAQTLSKFQKDLKYRAGLRNEKKMKEEKEVSLQRAQEEEKVRVLKEAPFNLEEDFGASLHHAVLYKSREEGDMLWETAEDNVHARSMDVALVKDDNAESGDSTSMTSLASSLPNVSSSTSSPSDASVLNPASLAGSPSSLSTSSSSSTTTSCWGRGSSSSNPSFAQVLRAPSYTLAMDSGAGESGQSGKKGKRGRQKVLLSTTSAKRNY